MNGFCTLSHKELRFVVPERYADEVQEYWRTLPPELFESARGLPDRIGNAERVLRAGADSPDGLSPAALDAALNALALTGPTSSPQELAKCSVYELRRDPTSALDAARGIAESAVLMRALFGWLRESLAESLSNSSRFFRKRDTLLEIASYCGQHSPAAVFNLIEEMGLEDLLIKASIRHPEFNGRAGAVALLGYLRNPGTGFLSALKSGPDGHGRGSAIGPGDGSPMR